MSLGHPVARFDALTGAKSAGTLALYPLVECTSAKTGRYGPAQGLGGDDGTAS